MAVETQLIKIKAAEEKGISQTHDRIDPASS